MHSRVIYTDNSELQKSTCIHSFATLKDNRDRITVPTGKM